MLTQEGHIVDYFDGWDLFWKFYFHHGRSEKLDFGLEKKLIFH